MLQWKYIRKTANFSFFLFWSGITFYSFVLVYVCARVRDCWSFFFLLFFLFPSFFLSFFLFFFLFIFLYWHVGAWHTKTNTFIVFELRFSFFFVVKSSQNILHFRRFYKWLNILKFIYLFHSFTHFAIYTNQYLVHVLVAIVAHNFHFGIDYSFWPYRMCVCVFFF